MESDLRTYPKMAFASFWLHLGAFIVDAIIYIVSFISLTAAGGFLAVRLTYISPHLSHLGQVAQQQEAFMFGGVIAIYLLIALFSFYIIVMHKKYGATLGKLICKIKLRKLDGTPLTYKDAILRFLPYLIFLILSAIDQTTIVNGFFLLWCIGSAIYIAKDRYHRAPHDLLAKTVVIKV